MSGKQNPRVDSNPATTSPCVSQCCLDDKDICLGCFRSLEEIKAWHQASEAVRSQIVAQAQRRRRVRNTHSFDNFWQLKSRRLK